MKPVTQTIVGRQGNCYAACLASIFEISIEEVPEFHDGVVAGMDSNEVNRIWNTNVRNWLRDCFGLGVVVLTFENANQWHGLWLQGYHIVSGGSPREPGMLHATVWHDGVMVHDPHPVPAPLMDLKVIDILYPINPAKLK
jgi:hypothetical protein